MLSPSHPIRFFFSYNSRKALRIVKNEFQKNSFAKPYEGSILPILLQEHKLPIYRDLPGVAGYLFENKKTNLKLALDSMNKIMIEPNEIFSFWNLVGPPTPERGFLPGLVISKGRASEGIGGGLCQLANLIYWLFLHSEIESIERHRHSFDVFPDFERKIPFGIGATVVYNYKDLRFVNKTNRRYQLCFELNDTELSGKLYADTLENYNYRIDERRHHFKKIGDDFYRSNEVYRIKTDKINEIITEEIVSKNFCKCNYTPREIL